MLLWAAASHQWAESLAEARACRCAGDPIFRSFVPREDLRSWITQAADAAARTGSGSAAANHIYRGSLAVGFSVMTLLVKSSRESALQNSFFALKLQSCRARFRETASTELAACLARIVRRVVVSEALASWRCLLIATPSQCHGSSADTLAQSLVEAWEPLWASRAILLQRALRQVVRASVAAPLRRLRYAAPVSGSAFGRAVGAPGKTELPLPNDPATTHACCRGLVLVMRRCIKHRLGIAWRRLACRGARIGLAAVLDTIDLQLNGVEECMQLASAQDGL